MRIVELCGLGASFLLAGVAALQDPQEPGPGQGLTHVKAGERPAGTPGKDDPNFRVDCDDWATVRPPDEEIWQKLGEADMTLQQAISIAEEYAREERGFENVRVRMAQFVPSQKPFYEVEVLTWNEDKENALRWQVYVGLKTKQVKRWMIQERFPGTPVRGEVIAMESGLMYHDVREGDGPLVTENSTVKVNYVGTILDGSLIFDTYEARKPETFVVSRAPLRGMAEGLVGARQGGKRKLILPPDLAYGERGYPDYVPPHATVVFDIEILEVD